MYLFNIFICLFIYLFLSLFTYLVMFYFCISFIQLFIHFWKYIVEKQPLNPSQSMPGEPLGTSYEACHFQYTRELCGIAFLTLSVSCS